MKKVVLIPDSFKGTMPSAKICSIMSEAIHGVYPECLTISIPVADGGEGTVDAFIEAVGGSKIFKDVTGPYPGERCMGYYGILPDGTAVAEVASTASLPMVDGRKNPSKTTSYGVGEIIMEAVSNGAKKVIVGLGGSCTNDGGTGLAAACGVKFLDSSGNEFVPVGGTLSDIDSIDASGVVSGVEIIAMCDIDNPFFGNDGAAYVYGPQKGADEDMVEFLDSNLRHLASVIERDLGIDVSEIPGAGAAGGIGGGMAAFLSASLKMGIEVVLDTVGFEELLSDADAVFTGEGKIDGQSLRGKVVIGVARRARLMNVPVIAVVGDIGEGAERAYEEGVSGIFSTNRAAVPYAEARLRAEKDMFLTMDNLIRFIKRVSGQWQSG